MESTPTISSVFPRHLFWDLDYLKLSVKQDSDIVIPRALYFTDNHSFSEDIAKLETFYEPQEIVRQLQNTKELISNEVCKMVAERYSVPLFRRFSPV